MDVAQLDADLVALAKKRNELSALDYADPTYDDTEEALHDMEDDFLEKYEKYLENVLQSVHDEYCPESEVLLPIAYLAKHYVEKIDENGQVIYDADMSQGVLVEVEQLLKHDTRLVLVPNPPRIVMHIDKAQAEVVWQP
jgi:hypothetical protein